MDFQKIRFTVRDHWQMMKIVLFLQTLFFAGILSASPDFLTLQSRIVKPDGQNLEAATVNYRFSITDPVGTCVVYQEDFSNVSMVGSKGLVSIKIGSGTRGYPVAATTMKDVFTNFNSPVFNCQAGGTYTAASADQRKLVMQFNDGSGWQTVPSLEINSTPFSLQALSAQQLGAFPAADYVRAAQFVTCVGGEAVHFNGTNFTCVSLGGGAASSVAAAAGLVGTPSISFSGDSNTGFYSGAADTISISNNGSNTFNITSTAVSSTTTGGATITQTNGTAAAPTFSFTGDADTGWYRAAADTLAASTAGAERMRIDSSGNVGIGTAATSALLTVVGTDISSGSALPNVLTVQGANNIGGGSNAGAGIFLAGGSGNNGNGNGASLTLQGGNWGGGGGITLQAGRSGGGGVATPINILGAVGSTNNTPGGAINITGGHAGNVFAGGAINIVAGNGGGGNGNGANVSINPGVKGGTGLDGNVLIATTSGKVGIGTINPLSNLTVKSSGNGTSNFDVQSAAGSSLFNISDDGFGTSILNNNDVLKSWGWSAAGPALWLNGGSNVSSGGGGSALQIRIPNVTGQQNGIFFSAETTHNGNTGAAITHYNSNQSQFGNGGLYFKTANSNILQTRMTIDDVGNVGIGTTNPGQALDVVGTGRFSYRTVVGTTGVGAAAYSYVRRNTGLTGDDNLFLDNVEFGANITSTIQFATGGSGYARINGGQDASAAAVLTFDTGGSERMRINSSGNVGIGTTSPQTTFQVEGVISPATNNTYTLGNASYRFTEVYATNGVINTSDRREKKDIDDTDLGLDFINKLRPVSYRWNTGVDHDVHYGLIAQEADQALAAVGKHKKTSIVTRNEQADRFGIRYSELIAPLIKAAQELYHRLVGIEAHQSHQDHDIASLYEENAKLKAQLDRQKRESVAQQIQLTAQQRELAEIKRKLGL